MQFFPCRMLQIPFVSPNECVKPNHWTLYTMHSGTLLFWSDAIQAKALKHAMLYPTRCWADLNANKHPKGKQDNGIKHTAEIRARFVHNQTFLSFQNFLKFLSSTISFHPLVKVCPAECNILAKSVFSPSLAHIYPQSKKDIYLSTNFYFLCWKFLCSLHRAEQHLLTGTEPAEDRIGRWRQWVFCCLPSVLSLRVNFQIFHPTSLLRWLPKALPKIDQS